MCLLVSYFRTMWENAIDKVIDAASLVLCEELGEIVMEKRRKHCTIAQLSVPTYAQLKRHRLKLIKNHLKNSYMFRSSTIFRELQCPC